MIRFWICFCIQVLVFFPFCIAFYGSILFGFGFIKIRKVRIAQWIGKWLAKSWLIIARVPVQIELEPGLQFSHFTKFKNILMCNHASSYDTFALQGAFPHPVRFLFKKSLLRIPFFGLGLYILGSIPVYRKNAQKQREDVQNAVRTLPKGDFIAIFSEGGRTETGAIQPFKKGIFHMCQEGDDVAIIPVGITGSYEILSIYSWQLNPGKIIMRLGNPIFKKDLPSDPNQAVKILQSVVQKLCDKTLSMN